MTRTPRGSAAVPRALHLGLLWACVGATACTTPPGASESASTGTSESGASETATGETATETETGETATETETGETETGETGEPEGPSPEAQAYCPGDIELVEARIDTLLAELDVEAKIDLMAGVGLTANEGGLWATPGIEARELPGLHMVDGPRGVSAGTGNATAFPVGAARGATWDPELEHRVGAAMAREAWAKGATVLLAPTVNILRHPRWGRAQETYGEEPHHVAQLGAAFIEGVQSEGVMASVKHLAANSIEDTRFTVDVSIDERALREVYLEPFEVAVREAQVASVMTAYNLVNGAYCAENVPLVRDILKNEWGFAGFVESDWGLGTRSTLPSLAAGLDIEMPQPMFYGNSLRIAAANGTADLALIDDAVRRIARAQWCYGLDLESPTLDPAAIETPAHLELAYEAALASMTLLRNEQLEGQPALPLAREAITRIVVLGELAAAENIGDEGSSSVDPSEVVTALEGISGAAEGVLVDYLEPDVDLLDPEIAMQVASADAVVLVTGLTSADEGEGLIAAGDRQSMSLRAEQVARIEAVAGLNPRTLVVLEGGSSIVVDPWADLVPAILMAWYPGARGGDAIAAVVFGDADPGGRSPVSWPAAEADLPPFINDSDAVTYDLWHGYRHLQREGVAPRFAFGHGLSYTSFAFEQLELDHDEGTDIVHARVQVTNTGARSGVSVVQLYAGALEPALERPLRELEGFARVELDAGASAQLEFELDARALSVWIDGAFTRPAGDYRFEVGSSSAELPLAQTLSLP